ncbi:ATP-grasp domain-containing protein [bacterium]|nr:ATP-grasp domain-containing protein [bacterium]
MMNQKTNILILSANWRADLVRAFQKALARRGGGKVIAADMSALSAALFAGDEYEVVPALNSPGFIDHLLGICTRRDISAIIPSIDKDLPVLAAATERLMAAGIRPVVSDPDAIGICDDKLRTYQYFVERRFPTPTSWLPSEFFASEPRPDWPILIKPRRGIGGKGVHRINSAEELDFWLKRVPDPILQEFLPGIEYSFDTLSDFNGKALSVVPRERLYVRDGEVFKARTVLNEQFIELVASVAEALGLRGPAVIQGILDGQGDLKLTEINPRFGSGILLAIAAGADQAFDLVRLVQGEAVQPSLGQFTDGLYMLRHYDAFFATAEQLPK